MTRVLAIDAGMNVGYGAVGGGVAPVSGSRALKGSPRRMGVTGLDALETVRNLVLQHKPDVVAYAAPFVGRFVKPDNIRPLMSITTIVEMVVEEINKGRPAGRKIRCVEVDEPEARRAFLTAVPRGTRAIKIAVQRACFARGWPCSDDHAGDALCVAAWALECVDPGHAHETTPLFQGGRG